MMLFHPGLRGGAPVADTTAPTLSSATASSTGATTGSVGVTTNEANGTLYVSVTTSATQPSVAQIKAGQTHTGAAATYSSSQSISSTGAKTFSATGLTTDTTYYAHFVHTDAAANDSNRLSSSGFTPVTSGVFFEADFSLTTYAAFAAQFNDINAYDGGGGASYQAVPAYINGFNHTGTGSGKRSFRCTYMEDDSGIEVKYGPFTATPSLYIRTREYLAPAGAPSGIATSGNAGWDGNMPAGLKTGRYFTNNNWATDDGSGGWAYQSEKLLYAPEYAGGVGSTWNESRGFGSGNYNYDRDGYYVTPWRDPQNLGDWNGYAQYDAPFNISDGNTNPWIKEGQWYLLERWLVLNSSASANGGAGSADGIWIVKINGVTVINFSNMQWLSTSRGCDNGASGWQTAWFCGNYSAGNAYFAYPGQGTPMERYISEMYLSTTADWVS